MATIAAGAARMTRAPEPVGSDRQPRASQGARTFACPICSRSVAAVAPVDAGNLYCPRCGVHLYPKSR